MTYPPLPLLFSNNTLHMPSGGGEYNYVLDALVTPAHQEGIEDGIYEHEMAHRAFVLAAMESSTFTLLNAYAGIAHGLLWFISRLASEYRLHIHLISPGLLEAVPIQNVGHTSKADVEQAVAAIDILQRRLTDLEIIHDSAARALAPIAEVAAIDYAPRVVGQLPWYLAESDVEGPLPSDNQKRELIEEVIAQYPVNFGGYHITYGSFQNAMRKAWDAFQSVRNYMVRKELLRLAMSVQYLDEREQIYTVDPIRLILQMAPKLRDADRSASIALFTERQMIGLRTTILAHNLKDRFLQDIAEEAKRVADLPERLHGLIMNQVKDSQQRWQIFPSQANMYYGSEADGGFITFVYDGTKSTVFINTALLEKYQDDGMFKDLPKEWWKLALTMELFRQAVKNGGKVSCPFREWKIVGSKDVAIPVDCGATCYFRKWLRNTGQWLDLVTDQPTCHIEDR